MTDEMNKISYEEGEHAWFTMIPNCVDDTPLDVYSFRLYVHLRRVAGEDGTCFQSTNTMAKWCQMSGHKIVESKKRLADIGLIRISKVVAKNGGRSCDHIRIINIWESNFKFYSENKEHPNDIDIST